MIQTFAIESPARRVEFSMDLDPSYPQDAAILYFLQHGKPPEPELCQLMLHLLKPGDYVIDGGANIGFFSLLASACGATVTAVEPCQATVRKLLRNIEVNSKIWTGSVRPAALCDMVGTASFYEQADSGFNALWGDDATGQVATTTLEALASTTPPRLVKLDIEGSEALALYSCPWPEDSSVFIVAECNVAALAKMGGTIEDMRGLMGRRGYDAFRLDAAGGLPALIPRETKIEPTRENANVLFAALAEVARVWPSVAI